MNKDKQPIVGAIRVDRHLDREARNVDVHAHAEVGLFWPLPAPVLSTWAYADHPRPLAGIVVLGETAGLPLPVGHAVRS